MCIANKSIWFLIHLLIFCMWFFVSPSEGNIFVLDFAISSIFIILLAKLLGHNYGEQLLSAILLVFVLLIYAPIHSLLSLKLTRKPYIVIKYQAKDSVHKYLGLLNLLLGVATKARLVKVTENNQLELHFFGSQKQASIFTNILKNHIEKHCYYLLVNK